MGKGVFDKKSCLRFKLVHRSVLDDGDTDAVVAGDREFVPIDSKSSARMDVLREGMAPRRVTFADDVAGAADGLAGTAPVDPEAAVAAHAGEAAKYGVFFDDRAYDYTQHLRAIGAEPGAVFVPAAGEEYTAHEDTPPDVAHDPRLASDDDALAEVMDALDDDDYVDAEGFADDLVVNMDRTYTAVLCSDDDAYSTESASDSDDESLVYGCAPSVACTSRTLAPSTFAPSLAATTTLENRFDAVLRLYDSDDGADADVRGLASDSEDDGDAALLRALGEFESCEREYMHPDAAARRRAVVELLSTVRADLGPVSASIMERFAHESSSAEECAEDLSSEKRVAHDVQSILTARAGADNVPALIRDATRSGAVRATRRQTREDVSDKESPSEFEEPRENRGVARSREESAEDKRARKAAVRAERRSARALKKDARVRSVA